MKFVDESGNTIWESAQTSIPYSYFTADSGGFILSTGRERSYIRSMGDVSYFMVNVPTGTDDDFDLLNGSRIHVRGTSVSPDARILTLFTHWGDGYPWNGMFTISYVDINGQRYVKQNIFWQPEGAGAYVVGYVEARRNQNTGEIESYYVYYQKVSAWTEEQIEYHTQFFMGMNESEDDPSTTQGGNGLYDLTSTVDVDFPSLPDVSLLDSNMIHAYAMTVPQTRDLSAWFWDDSLWETFKKLFDNPIEGLISFGILPIDASHALNPEFVTVGTATSTTAKGYPVTTDWYLMDFGTFDVPETWGSFIDYTSTTLNIYLPYIGVKQLDIQECMSSRLHLKYYINCITGDCVAMLKVQKFVDDKNIASVNSVLYEFNGNCLVQVPLTASDFSGRLSSAISSAGAIIGSTIATVASDGALAPMLASSLVSAGSSMLTSSKANVIKTGNMSGITGYMSVQFPFLILDRPSQNIPAEFNKYRGRSSMITAPLTQMRGFTKIHSCVLDSIPCSDEERAEIDRLLKSGVIV